MALNAAQALQIQHLDFLADCQGILGFETKLNRKRSGTSSTRYSIEGAGEGIVFA